MGKNCNFKCKKTLIVMFSILFAFMTFFVINEKLEAASYDNISFIINDDDQSDFDLTQLIDDDSYNKVQFMTPDLDMSDTLLYLQLPETWVSYADIVYYQIMISSNGDKLTESFESSKYPLNINEGNWESFIGEDDNSNIVAKLLSWSDDWFENNDSELVTETSYCISIRMKLYGTDIFYLFDYEFMYTDRVGEIVGLISSQSFNSNQAISSNSTDNYVRFLFTYSTPMGYTSIPSSYGLSEDSIQVTLDGSSLVIDSVNRGEENGYYVKVGITKNGLYEASVTFTQDGEARVVTVSTDIKNVYNEDETDITNYLTSYEKIAIFDNSEFSFDYNESISHLGSTYTTVGYQNESGIWVADKESILTLNTNIGIDDTLIVWKLKLNGISLPSVYGKNYSELFKKIGEYGVGDYVLIVELGTISPIEIHHIDINVINIIGLTFNDGEDVYFHNKNHDLSNKIGDYEGYFSVEGLLKNSPSSVSYLVNNSSSVAIKNAATYTITPVNIESNTYDSDYFYVYNATDGSFVVNKATTISFLNEAGKIDTLKFMDPVTGLSYVDINQTSGTSFALVTETNISSNYRMLLLNQVRPLLSFNATVEHKIFGSEEWNVVSNIAGVSSSTNNDPGIGSIISQIKGSKAGTYRIVLKVTSNNYDYTETVNVTIAKRSSNDFDSSAICDNLVYNGKEQSPSCSVVIKNAETIVFEVTVELTTNTAKTDVGTYSSEYSYDGDANHESKTGTLTWNISPMSIHIAFKDGSKVYDGNQDFKLGICESTSSTGCFMVSPESDHTKLLAKNLRNQIIVSYEPTLLVEKGVYEVYATGINNSNFSFDAFESESGIFEISTYVLKIENKVVSSEAKYTGSGIEILLLKIYNEENEIYSDLVEGTLIVSKDGEIITPNNNEISITDTGYKYTSSDVGVYNFTFIVGDDYKDSFSQASYTYSFTIKKANLTYTADFVDSSYNGESTDFSLMSMYKFSGLSSSDKIDSFDYEVKLDNKIVTEVKNAGTYYVTITGIKVVNRNDSSDKTHNYEFENPTLTYTISKRNASISFITGELTFKDEIIDLSSRVCMVGESCEYTSAYFLIDGFVEEDITRDGEENYTIIYTTEYLDSSIGNYVAKGQIKEAGQYRLLSLDGYRVTESSKTANYDISVTVGYLTVSPIKIVLSFPNSTFVKMPNEHVNIGVCLSKEETSCIRVSVENMDDEELSALIETIKDDITFSVDSIDINNDFIIGDLDEFGEYTIYPKLDNVNYSYKYRTGKLTVVKPKLLIVYSVSTGLTYNGEEQEIANFRLEYNSSKIEEKLSEFEYSYSINGGEDIAVTAEDITKGVSIKKVNAGTYSIKVSIHNTKALEGYEFEEATFEVEIFQNSGDAEIYELVCETLTYNGETQLPNCSLKNGGTVVYSTGVSYKNAGLYTGNFEVTPEDSNYISKTITKVWEIEQSILNVSFNSRTEMYTGSWFNLNDRENYTITGNWYETEEITMVDYYVVRSSDQTMILKENVKDIGVYIVYSNLVLSSDFSKNYRVKNNTDKDGNSVENETTFTIKTIDDIAIDIVNVTESLTYNGNLQDIGTVSIYPYSADWGWKISFSVLVGGSTKSLVVNHETNEYGLKYVMVGNVATIKATYAGTYKISVSISGDTVSPCSAEGVGSTVISAKAATVTFKDYEFIYGSEVLTVSDDEYGICSTQLSGCFELAGFTSSVEKIEFKVLKLDSESGTFVYVEDENHNTIFTYFEIIDAGTYKIQIVDVVPTEITINEVSNYDINWIEVENASKGEYFGKVEVSQYDISKELIFKDNECKYNGNACLFKVVGSYITTYGETLNPEEHFSVNVEKMNSSSVYQPYDYKSNGEAANVNTIQPLLKNAGVYKITIDLSHPNYSYEGNNVVYVTINKAKIDDLQLDYSANNLTYTGENISLIKSMSLKFSGSSTEIANLSDGIKIEGFEMKVCIGDSCNGYPAYKYGTIDNLSADKMPVGKDAGDYVVRFEIIETDNFEGGSITRSVTIAKRTVKVVFNDVTISYSMFEKVAMYPDFTDPDKYTFDYSFIPSEMPTGVLWELKSGQSTITNYLNPNFASLVAGNSYSIKVLGLVNDNNVDLNYNKNFNIVNESVLGTITVSKASSIEINTFEGKTNLYYNKVDQKLINFEVNINGEIGDVLFTYMYCGHTQNCDGEEKVVEGHNNVVGKYAGYYYITKVYISGGGNYEPIEMNKNIEVYINKATHNVNVSYPISKSYIYQGHEIHVPYNGSLPIGLGVDQVQVTTRYYLCDENDICTSEVSPINVGRYKVESTFTVSENYNEIAPISTIFTINKASLPSDLGWSQFETVIYDGNEYEISIVRESGKSVNETEYGDDIIITYETSYKNTDNVTTNLGNVNKFTNAGTYTITAHVSAGSNYKDENFGPITFVIKAKELYFYMNDQEVVYNGNKHIIPLLTNDEYDKNQLTFKYFVDGNENSFGVADAGEYEITAQITCASGNYKYAINSDLSAVLVINKAALGEIESIDSVVYNGQNQVPEVVIDGIDNSNYELAYSLNGETIAESNIKDAGEYTITATGKGNYTGTVIASYVINKIEIEIAFIDNVLIYDGNTYTFNSLDYYYSIVGEFVRGEEPSEITYVIEGSVGTEISNVGVYTIEPISIGDEYTTNYAISYKKGTFAISNGDNLEVYIVGGKDLIYTGTNVVLVDEVKTNHPVSNGTFSYSYCKLNESSVCIEETVISGNDIDLNNLKNVNEYFSVVDAGAYKVNITIDELNFEPASSEVTIVINKAEYDMTSIKKNFSDKDVAYTGIDWNVTVGNLSSYPGLSVEYVCVSGNCGEIIGNGYYIKNVGEYDIRADFNVSDDYKNNYIVPDSLTAHIVIRKATGYIEASDISLPYSLEGINFTKYVKVNTEQNLKYIYNSNTYDISLPLELNAGEYEIVFVAVGNDNFEELTTSIKVNILPVSLNVTWENVENTYSYDNFNGIEVTYTLGIKLEYSGVDLTESLEEDIVREGIWSASQAGTYTVTYTVEDRDGNFKPISGTKTWNIKKAKLNFAFSDDKSFVYDGTAKTVEIINTNNVTDCNYIYTYKTSDNSIIESAPINAGQYKLSVLISKTNYEDLVLEEVEFVIEKYTINNFSDVVIFGDKTVNYSKGLTSTLTIKDFNQSEFDKPENGILPEISIQYVRDGSATNSLEVSEVGNYHYEARIIELTGNYNIINSLEADLIIQKSTLDITLVNIDARCSLEDNLLTCIYNGEEIVIEAKVDDSDIVLNYNYSPSSIILVGNYTVEVSYEETSNYLANSITINVAVNAADLDISGINSSIEDITYDGEDHASDITLNLGSDESLSIKSKTFKFNGEVVNEVVNAGVYTVEFVISKDGHKDEVIMSEFKVLKAVYEVEIQYAGSILYQHQGYSSNFEQIVDVTINNFDDSEVTVSYNVVYSSMDGHSDEYEDITYDELKHCIKNAGYYTITLLLAETSNFESYEEEFNITVLRTSLPQPDIEYLYDHLGNVVSDFVYTGEKISFVKSITLYYDDRSIIDPNDYGDWIKIENSYGTEVKDGYHFKVSVSQTNNYHSSLLTEYIFNIKASSIDDLIVVEESTDLVYTGESLKLATITLYDKEGHLEYDFSKYGTMSCEVTSMKTNITTTQDCSNLSAINAGSYTIMIVVEPSDNSYTRYEKKVEVEIAKADMTDKFTFSAQKDLIYNGKSQNLLSYETELENYEYSIEYYFCSSLNIDKCGEPSSSSAKKDANLYYVAYEIRDKTGNYLDLKDVYNEAIVISPKVLNLSELKVKSGVDVTKVYDGTTDILGTDIFEFNSTALGDGDSSLDLNLKTTVIYQNKDVGNNIPLVVKNIEISNSNYQINSDDELPFITTLEGSITKKEVNLVTATNMLVVGGLGRVTFSICELAGLIEGETISVICPNDIIIDTKQSGTFDIVNDVIEKITYNEINSIGNYSIINPEHIYVSVGNKELTASDLEFSGLTKEYDGTTNVPTDFAIKVKENAISVDNDKYRVTYESARFENEDVGVNKKIYVTKIVLEYFDGENWLASVNYSLSLASLEISNGLILKRSIDVSKFEVSVQEKTYNGSSLASVVLSNTSCDLTARSENVCILLNTDSGILEKDLLTLSNSIGVFANYDDVNVGTRTIIFERIYFLESYESFTKNYSLTGEISSINDAVITQAKYQMMDGTFAVQAGTNIKEYDGTLVSNIKINPVSVNNDLLQLEVLSAFYETINAGENIKINVNLGSSSNYLLVDENGDQINELVIENGVINKKELQWSIEAEPRNAIRGYTEIKFSKCEPINLVEADRDRVEYSCAGQISGDGYGDYTVFTTIMANYMDETPLTDNYSYQENIFSGIRVSISKTNIELFATGKSNLVYDGTNLDLIESITYKLGDDEFDIEEIDSSAKLSYCYIIDGEEDCSNNDRTQKNAGTYQIKVKLTNSLYYSDVETSPIEIVISKQKFNNDIVVSSGLVYSGQHQVLASSDFDSDVDDNAHVEYYVKYGEFDWTIVTVNKDNNVYIEDGDIFAKDAGKYDIKVTITTDDGSDFASDVLEKTVIIDKKTLEIGFVSDDDLSYDGNIKDYSGRVCNDGDIEKFCLKVDGLVSDEQVYSYNLKLTYKSLPANIIISAGSYKIEDITDVVISSVSGSSSALVNYNVTINHINEYINILKKKIDITINDVSKYFGEADPKFLYTITGLVEGDSIEVPVIRETGENITENEDYYSIYCDTTNFISSNYEINTCVDGKFTIKSYKLIIQINYYNDNGLSIAKEEQIKDQYYVDDDLDVTYFAHQINGYEYSNSYLYNGVEQSTPVINGLRAKYAQNNEKIAYIELIYTSIVYDRVIELCSADPNDKNASYCYSSLNDIVISGKAGTETKIALPAWANHKPIMPQAGISEDKETNVYYYSYYFSYEQDNPDVVGNTPIKIKYSPVLLNITIQPHICENAISESCYIKDKTRNSSVLYGTTNYQIPVFVISGYTIHEDYKNVVLNEVLEATTIYIKYVPQTINVYLKLMEIDLKDNITSVIKPKTLYKEKVAYNENLKIEIPECDGYASYGYLQGIAIETFENKEDSFNMLIQSNQKEFEITIYYLKINYPVIYLQGDASITLKLNEDYKEKGAYVIDGFGNRKPLTAENISWEEGFDKSKVGTYYRVYNYVDENGYPAATVKREVKVLDDTKPVIILTKKSISIVIGTTVDWNAYIKELSDPYDIKENLNLEIDLNGFDVNKKGTYSVTYKVTDASNNVSLAVLEVNVVAGAKTKSSLPLIPMVVGVFGVVGVGVGGTFVYKYLKKKNSEGYITDEDDDDSAF